MAKTRLHYAKFAPSAPPRATEVVTIRPDAACPFCGSPLYVGREPHVCRQGYGR